MKRHPKYDEIVKLLHDGRTDSHIELNLHVGRAAVTRIRAAEGIAPVVRPQTLYEKLLAGLGLPEDIDGHIVWIGVRSHGTPIIKHRGVEHPAAAIAFQIRTGRGQVGQARADCGMKHCMNGLHISDEIERRRMRLQLRAMIGLPAPWAECKHGHDWEGNGRIEPEPSLMLYCQACATGRDKRLARNGGSRPRWSR